MCFRLLALPLLTAALVPAILAQSVPPGAQGAGSDTGKLLQQLSQTKRVGAVALSPDGRTLAMVLAGQLTVAPVPLRVDPRCLR